MKVLRSLKELKSYFKEDKIKIILLTLVNIISNISGLLYSAIWAFILQFLIDRRFFAAILLLIGFLIFIVLDILLDICHKYLVTKIESNSLKKIQIDLFKHINNFPAVAYEEHGVGEFSNRIINDTDPILSTFTSFVSLVGLFISVIIIIIVFLKIHMVLGIELIVFAIIMYFLSKYFSPILKKENKSLKSQNDELMKDTTQVLTGIREVKSLGIKQNVFKLITNKFDKVYESYNSSQRIEREHYGAQWITFALCQFVVILTAIIMFYHGKIAIAIVILVYSYLGRINWAVSSFTDFTSNYQKLAVSFERLTEVLNNGLYHVEQFGNEVLVNPVGSISFKSVSFTYPNDEKRTLQGIDLEIKPNIKTAIVGASGSGKTSLFNLLCRYFEPNKGKILIDNVPIKDLTEESLRQLVGIIRQDTFLFNMSIMDNFRMVKEDITLSEVRKACKKAYIDSYIMSLQHGYDTIIGENGVNLSGGQKQRLSIARTLIRDTKIILFDEATSSLDNKSQEYIKKTIDNLVKDHAVVIIAHRLSTIVDSDEILLMEKGKIIDKGSHRKLMKNPKYKELYKADIIK